MLNYSLTNYQLPTKKKTSKRAEIIKELYRLYEEDKINRKKDNWKRFVTYLKSTGKRDSETNRQDFKKSREFIKEVTVGTFCFFLSHIKTQDLPTMLSVAKDKRARKENVGAFIAGHFSKQIK